MSRLFAFALALTMIAPSSVAAQAPAGSGAPRPPQGVHYVYLIRHGQYDRDTTVTDDRLGNGLDALGHEQAKKLGARLAGLPIRFHALVSSDFARARETAAELAAILHMSVAIDSLLHECTPTSDNARIMRDETPESIALCDEHRAAAWARYVVPTPEADTHDLLVCHGNVIRWMVTKAVGGDVRHWASMDIANASLTILAVRADGSVRLVMYSDVGHLPLDLQTWTGRGAGWGSAAAAKAMR
ncbi:MAG TPA: histidine phosphatase family protein [Candidatus Acidoferrales bacterium]|nr:histidine phosphatase family protein [Candidatus Acidoferrales bacterium]